MEGAASVSDQEKPFELPDTPPTVAGPGPLTKAAIDQAKNLPTNELTAGATTTDFKTIDATVGVQKRWTNGWGVGAFLAAKIGTGRPQGSAGVLVTKKLGLLGGVAFMNPMYKAMIAGVARTILAAAAVKGIQLDNELVEAAVQAAVVAAVAGWSVYQKFKVDRKLKKVAATGVNS